VSSVCAARREPRRPGSTQVLFALYVDKPMRGHGLMQAIARVNRVFKDKPGGLVVDYLGLADELKLALATYTTRDTYCPDIRAVHPVSL
jgi:type I site-specific restriction-modification system R (restriction) subunit